MSTLGPGPLIVLKAHAWVDLRRRHAAGEFVKERDLRKHRQDVFRLLQLVVPGNPPLPLSPALFRDVEDFLATMAAEPYDTAPSASAPPIPKFSEEYMRCSQKDPSPQKLSNGRTGTFDNCMGLGGRENVLVGDAASAPLCLCLFGPLCGFFPSASLPPARTKPRPPWMGVVVSLCGAKSYTAWKSNSAVFRGMEVPFLVAFDSGALEGDGNEEPCGGGEPREDAGASADRVFGQSLERGYGGEADEEPEKE